MPVDDHENYSPIIEAMNEEEYVMHLPGSSCADRDLAYEDWLTQDEAQHAKHDAYFGRAT